MMLVIGNGKLFTRNDEMPFVENGAVAIEGTKIAAVGETEAIKKQYGDAEFIDAKGGVIMPAFINTHEHIYSAMARGLSIKGYLPLVFRCIRQPSIIWPVVHPMSITVHGRTGW